MLDVSLSNRSQILTRMEKLTNNENWPKFTTAVLGVETWFCCLNAQKNILATLSDIKHLWLKWSNALLQFLSTTVWARTPSITDRLKLGNSMHLAVETLVVRQHGCKFQISPDPCSDKTLWRFTNGYKFSLTTTYRRFWLIDLHIELVIAKSERIPSPMQSLYCERDRFLTQFPSKLICPTGGTFLQSLATP